jgi:hypothetical protein
MVPMRAASHSVRFAWAAILALLLAVRLLAPAGFMPAFDHGSVMIIACPDGDFSAASVMHHHHHPADHVPLHHPCPYASAAGLGAFGPDWTPVLLAIVFAAALRIGRAWLLSGRQRDQLRPPAIGPPISA